MNLVRDSEYNYILDAVFIKSLMYYHLRSKTPKMDEFYLDLLFKIKKKLGHVAEKSRMKFRLKLKREKSKPKGDLMED